MPGKAILPSDLLPFIRQINNQTLRYTFHNDLQWVKGPLRIGACVSGGPDSMALAYLLLELRQQETDIQHLSALIVDHKARPESTTEALQVQQNLAKIGLESTILTMQWPDNVNPLQLSDFESQARVKRYQMLARFALTRNIHHLFLGHHQDDQVETILMRMLRNKNISLKGLAGMASECSVPCEFDTYGVHTAQQDMLAPVCFSFPRSTRYLGLADPRRRSKGMPTLSISGGLKLQRPLLSFSKPDLIATCELNHVPYIVDPTNHDPTTNLRNAVRHLRTYHELPQALSTASLLQLNNTALQYLAHVKEAGEAALSTFRIERLDLRSGMLRVRIPRKKCRDLDELEACGYAIAKLTEMVTPHVRVNHNTSVPIHFTENFCWQAAETEQVWPPTAFTYDKVSFNPDTSQPGTWVLSRQPMTPAEIVENTMSFEYDSQTRSKKILWDNRFWIQITKCHADVLVHLEIRPLGAADLATLFELSATRSESNLLRQRLHATAPGKIRYTLPVLTFKKELLAVPTLGYYPLQLIHKMGPTQFHCTVSYNSFSTMDGFQPQPPTKPTVEEELKSTERTRDNLRTRFDEAYLRSDAFRSIRARRFPSRII